MTFKQIEKMPYGTKEQIKAVDEWYKRFMIFCENELHDQQSEIIESIWKRIHLTDIGYQARRRWMYN